MVDIKFMIDIKLIIDIKFMNMFYDILEEIYYFYWFKLIKITVIILYNFMLQIINYSFEFIIIN